MRKIHLKKKIATVVLSIGLPLLSVTTIQAQQQQAAGESLQTKPASTMDLESKEGITSQEVNQSINEAYRANDPLIRNFKKAKGNQSAASDKNTLYNPNILVGPRQTYEALGNSPVNNNSGAYNSRQAVNMPQSTITQPPLPYKNGGTYYQANDSLIRPPKRAW